MSDEASSSKRSRSIIHQYFDTEKKNDKNEVQCSQCTKWFSYNSSVTSNLLSHLRVSACNSFVLLNLCLLIGIFNF